MGGGTDIYKKFSRDKEICLLAFECERDNSLILVGEDCILLEDKEFMLKAVKLKKSNFLYVHDSLTNDAELLSLVGADSFHDYLEHDDEDEDDVIEIP